MVEFFVVVVMVMGIFHGGVDGWFEESGCEGGVMVRISLTFWGGEGTNSRSRCIPNILNL